MSSENEIKNIFERMNKEAFWCRTCMKRDKCEIKETVAMEKRLVSPYPVKNLKVSIQCRNYMKDCKLSDTPNVLESIFIV